MTSVKQITLDLLHYSAKKTVQEVQKPVIRKGPQQAEHIDMEEDEDDDDVGAYAPHSRYLSRHSDYRGQGRQLGSG